MYRIKQIIVGSALVCLSAIAMFACKDANSVTQITNMKCEYLEQPIGIDVRQPRLSWQLVSEANDVEQAAFRVSVASSAELLDNGQADIYTMQKAKGANTLVTLPDDVPFESFRIYYWRVEVWLKGSRTPIVSTTSQFETGAMSVDQFTANWISDGMDKDYEPAPMFRRVVEIEQKKIESARIYISGLGYYEAFINGKRVGENYLDPAYTAFDKRVYYVVHDVTDMLLSGKNSIGVVLGNGWYNVQSVAVWDFHKAHWRNRPRMICEMHVRYDDGSVQKIVSDELWKTSTGANTYNNIYSGDMYDSTLANEDWKMIDFDDSRWKQASIISDYEPIFMAQLFPPIRITNEVLPEAIYKISDNIYTFDLGQNIAGFCRLSINAPRGTKLHVKHGELLNDDFTLNQNNINVYYHPRQSKEIFQTDVYTAKGDGSTEVFQPSFTYHGFQYVQVESNKPIDMTRQSLSGLFLHTDLKQTGKFECSNEILNKLWRATNQSYLGNLHGIPTDCPQREKNGWTADAHVAMQTALFNYDGIKLYEKWMRDFIDNQKQDGQLSGIIPSAGWGYSDWIGPIWDSALFIVPDEIYNFYGDKRIIEECYPVMQKYLSYLKTKEDERGIINFGLSDWLTFKTQTPTDYTTTVYYYIQNRLMQKFSEIIGKDGRVYAEKAEELHGKINNLFYNSETNTYSNGSQTAQALALYAKIVPVGDEEKVAGRLAQIINDNDQFLDFGLLGTKTVPRMLTEYGYGDVALKMITRREAPSWGHWVEELGYTTLPETWTLNDNLSDGSLNHVFFGDVSAWMFQYLAGINYDVNKAGFEHIIVKPFFIEGVDWVKSEYDSVRGMIRSEWRREDGRIVLNLEIPAGAKATIYLNQKVKKVGSGRHQFVL